MGIGLQTLDIHHSFSRYWHAEYEDRRALGMEFGVLTHNGGAQMRWGPSGARQRSALGVWYEYRNYASAGLNFTPLMQKNMPAPFSRIANGNTALGRLRARCAPTCAASNRIK